jgi:hypothetical protein
MNTLEIYPGVYLKNNERISLHTTHAGYKHVFRVAGPTTQWKWHSETIELSKNATTRMLRHIRMNMTGTPNNPMGVEMFEENWDQGNPANGAPVVLNAQIESRHPRVRLHLTIMFQSGHGNVRWVLNAFDANLFRFYLHDGKPLKELT